MTLQEAISGYITNCSNVRKLEHLTIKAYKVDLGQFESFIAKLKIDTVTELNKVVVLNYINTISQSLSAATLKRKVASLKAFFNFLELDDVVQVSPFRKIRLNIKEPKKIPKALTLFDMQKLLQYLYSSKRKSVAHTRNIAIFELLFATGIRVSELCDIKLENICLFTNSILIRGKGNKERKAYLGEDSLVALQLYLGRRAKEPSPYLFINKYGQRLSSEFIRVIFKELGVAALEKHITPHMLRHTFATLLLEEGVDITYIKSFLGHSSLSTTQIYANSTTIHQRKILSNKHPRNRMCMAAAIV